MTLATHKLSDASRALGLMLAYAADLPLTPPDQIVKFLADTYGPKYAEGSLDEAGSRFFTIASAMRATAGLHKSAVTTAIERQLATQSLSAAIQTVAFRMPGARSKDLIDAGIACGAKYNTAAALVGGTRGYLKSLVDLPAYPKIGLLDAFGDDTAELREIVRHFWMDPAWRAMSERQFLAGVIRMNNGFDAKAFIDVLSDERSPCRFTKALIRSVFYTEVARCSAVGEERNGRGKFEGWSEEAKLRHMQKRAARREALWSELKIPRPAMHSACVTAALSAVPDSPPIDSPPEDEDAILARVAARHAARLAAVAVATDERDEGPPVGD